ncbi:unnamed protein product [Parnassius mnemosyne]|uniref:maleylacetoacetate isomerase n=1 Tax=Parnassius mnemosyne TaxID=213953 RepID=A0AAV1LVZ8_9NEOP
MVVEIRTTLYAFWLSSCSWRVRAGLHFKKIPFEEKPVDILREKRHLTEEFRTINPAQKVPALVIDGTTITESMAILQYLEETRPEPTLMPNTPLLRTRMREICEIIVSGIQPLQNVGLQSHFETKEKFHTFTKYWTERGLQTLEKQLKNTSGLYCVGDQISMADLCLVPQLYNAVTRFQMDLKQHPTVSKLYESLLQQEVFKETHPKNINKKIQE